MGLGKSTATTVNLAFTVLVNILPLPTSVLVDGVLGRYRSLQIFTWLVDILLLCALTHFNWLINVSCTPAASTQLDPQSFLRPPFLRKWRQVSRLPDLWLGRFSLLSASEGYKHPSSLSSVWARKQKQSALADWLAADQYTESDMRIRTNKQGQKVVEDRELTIQYIYNVYYW